MNLPSSINKKQITFFVLAIFISFLRGPDVITHAQFYAEDGAIWFQTAFNSHFSVNTIFQTYSGYFHLIPRTSALLSGFLPIREVPVYFNTIALVLSCLPIWYLWSSRLSKVINNDLAKLMITFAYILLPFTAELHANITNAQWYLAVTVLMLIVIENSKNRFVNYLEYSIIVVAGLSGPFSIFLAPLAAYYYHFYKRGNKELKIKTLLLIACAFLQVIAILFISHVDRHSAPIGISATYFFHILGGQVFGAAIGGSNSTTFLYSKTWIAPLLAGIGLLSLVYIFIKSKTELRLLICLGLFVLGAAMVSPLSAGPSTPPWWQTLSSRDNGARYYMIIHLALYTSLIWLLFYKKQIILKGLALSLLIVAAFTGIRSDFRYEKYPDKHFEGYASKIEKAQSSHAPITVPINPEGWELKLDN